MADDGRALTWEEIDRGEAAIALIAHRWQLPLNPEDCEMIAAAILGVAGSGASREQIYAETALAVSRHEETIKSMYKRGPESAR